MLKRKNCCVLNKDKDEIRKRANIEHYTDLAHAYVVSDATMRTFLLKNKMNYIKKRRGPK